jgi:hypothetical protein
MVLAVSCITVFGNNTNSPPFLNYLTSNKTSPQDTGAIITWTADATDPDDDSVLYRFFLNDKPITDWATDNMWIWKTNDVDVETNRIEVQVRDGKHADTSGLDDMRSAGFTLNPHATTAEPGVFKQVIITLYIKNGDKSGSSIPGAQVTGKDGSNNSFQQTADSNGAVAIKGYPGTWSFTASAVGYETNSWSQQIIDISAEDAFLQEIKVLQEPVYSPEPVNLNTAKVTLTLHIHEGSANGPGISGAQVIAQDGSGNSFHETTDRNGAVTIKGYPGTWSFTASAVGYETNSWSQQIIDISAEDAFLQKVQGKSSAYLKTNQLSGAKSADYTSIWNSNLWNTKWTKMGSGDKGRPAYRP